MSLGADKIDHSKHAAENAIPAERVWDMLSAIDVAMLVTHSDDGLHGRPMSTIPTPEKGVVYILTEQDSSAARHIRANGSVFLTYQGRGDHVALAGHATVDQDRGLVKDLWNPGAELFWPDGPDAHDVVALVIDPGRADIWDGPGVLRGIASILRRVATGRAPDMGTQGTTEL